MQDKPKRSPLSISVFFPCYNEEANVERTTQAALKMCRRVSDDFEVIIVNDGSKDGTAEIADRLAAEISEVRAIHNNPNLGYGGALQAGFRAATKNWPGWVDDDPNVRLKIGESTYEAVLVELEDPDQIRAVQERYAVKYDLGGGSGGDGGTRYWLVEPGPTGTD